MDPFELASIIRFVAQTSALTANSELDGTLRGQLKRMARVRAFICGHEARVLAKCGAHFGRHWFNL
jgi:hypothetical protein